MSIFLNEKSKETVKNASKRIDASYSMRATLALHRKESISRQAALKEHLQTRR